MRRSLVVAVGGVLLTAQGLALPAPPQPPQDPSFWQARRDLELRLQGRRPLRVLVQFDAEDRKTEDEMRKVHRAFLDAIGRVGGPGGGEPQRFRARPFLSLRLLPGDLRRIKELKGSFKFDDDEQIRFRVEPTPRFRLQAAPAVSSVPVAELLEKLGHGALPSTGAGTTIVVIDEGVDPDSGAIAGSVIDGCAVLGETPVCTLYPDGSDDPAAGSLESVEAKGPTHGTLVAGLASVVAPGAALVSIRVGDGSGALVTDVAAALQQVHCRWSEEEAPIAAVVLAMTSKEVAEADYPSHYKLIRDAVVDLQGLGIPVVVSAGNDSFSNRLAFPADVEEAVSVGGLNRALDARASFSNWHADLDLCAPASGVGLPVSWSGYDWSCTGTSYAAPIVAGILARLRERFPGCASDDLLRLLASTGEPVVVEAAGVVMEVPRLQLELAVAEIEAFHETVSTTPDPAPAPVSEPEPAPAPDPDPDREPEPDPAPDPSPAPDPESVCTCVEGCTCCPG